MGNREHAVRLFNQGVTAAQDPNPEFKKHAYQQFVSACYADPTYHLPFYQVGAANMDLDLVKGAVACFRRALECASTKEERVKALTNYGWALWGADRHSEALDASQQAVELDANAGPAWLNLALLWGILDKPMTALSCAKRARETAPDDPQYEYNLAFAHLFNGDFAEGLKHFESRFEHRLKQYTQYPFPRWRGEKDAVVFVVADQGLGDTLSFARFVEKAAERSQFLHLAVQPQLIRLFQHSFLRLKNVTVHPLQTVFPAADYWTTFVSLPHALGLSTAQIVAQPQITPPVIPPPRNWKTPDRDFHVGIAWSGSALNDIDRHRSIPIEHFLELTRVRGVQLYSLQVDEKKRQMHDIGAAAVIRDLSGYIDDVVSTVGILQDLDLVVTCESALGHICALAGKPCWIPYSYAGRDYRIGHTGERAIWTPKHRFFRQDASMTWAPVFDRIVEALEEIVYASDVGKTGHIGYGAGGRI